MEDGWRKEKTKEEKVRGKTRRQGGMKKRGRQKGKEHGGERGGQGGAVQTGTKLETQCVVIHSLLQLLCACPCLSVWVSGCEVVCVRVHISTPECRQR